MATVILEVFLQVIRGTSNPRCGNATQNISQRWQQINGTYKHWVVLCQKYASSQISIQKDATVATYGCCCRNANTQPVLTLFERTVVLCYYTHGFSFGCLAGCISLQPHSAKNWTHQVQGVFQRSYRLGFSDLLLYPYVSFKTPEAMSSATLREAALAASKASSLV